MTRAGSSRAVGRLGVGLVLAALHVASFAEVVDARPCGGGRPCECGNTVQGTAVLRADLEGCKGTALRLAPNARLDCAGHAIRGRGPAESDYGVRINKVADTEVENCTISGFKRGIRVRGGQRHHLHDNVLRENVIGIEVAGATESGQAADVRVERNRLERNQQDGIHLGAGTVRGVVHQNQMIRNGQESLYLLWCDDCRVTENRIEGAGTAGIYHKHTSDAYYADNVLVDSLFHVRGESSGNLFVRNVLRGTGYVFDGYTSRGYSHDPGWFRVPHHNEIVGGSVTGAKYCFRFQGAHDNRVRGTVAHACHPASSRDYDTRPATNNRLELREASSDWDGDEIANVSDPCTDVDGDGFGDRGFLATTCPLDNCPELSNPGQADGDGDGVGDACDLCPLAFDPGQFDRDFDGAGDACEPCVDRDGDGFGEGKGICPVDNCPSVPNADQFDVDMDGVGDACDRCPNDPDPEQEGPATCGIAPPADLTEADRERFLDGARAFTRIETPETGLGPGFNGTSCGECHNTPTAGGSSHRLITLFGLFGEDGFDPLPQHGGPVLQSQGIRTVGCSYPTEGIPRMALPRRRQSPPLYGSGLIEAIPDATILAGADPDDSDGDGISGRAHRVGETVGRFGWKATEPDLPGFVARALLQEMGITTPRHPTEERGARPARCDLVDDPEDDGARVALLSDFLRMLPPLEPAPAKAEAGEVEAGESVFVELGCAGCHTPALATGPDAPARIANRPVPLYSDLLLHDMGRVLGDGVEEGEAAGTEFRTPPLWGVGRSGPYLHDGRAPTLGLAVSMHGGEAQAARDAFLAREERDRRALIAFLESL